MSKKMISVQQTGSAIGRKAYQSQCLKGLGLGKMHKIVQVEDTPAVRGMIDKVNHLVQVIKD